MKRLVIIMAICALLSACASAPQKISYEAFRTESPKSILVVPVLNRSVDVGAPEYFLSTISRPLAERGYYVFPTHLVKRIMEDDGMSDADMVHANSPQQLGKLFGTDAIMYITIEQWGKGKLGLLSQSLTVEMSYVLKSAVTGDTLWKNKQIMSHSLSGISGAILGALIVATDYTILADQANSLAVSAKGKGLPAGPHDTLYKKDQADF